MNLAELLWETRAQTEDAALSRQRSFTEKCANGDNPVNSMRFEAFVNVNTFAFSSWEWEASEKTFLTLNINVDTVVVSLCVALLENEHESDRQRCRRVENRLTENTTIVWV